VSPSLRSLLPGSSNEAVAAKAAKPAVKPSAPAKENRLVRWYRETESELRKVVWPTRRELANLTVIVVAVTIVSGVFLGMIDFFFERNILMIR
jgi:preprotein translocase subunit SecE